MLKRDEPGRVVKLRNAESEAAARVAGIGPVRFLGHERVELADKEIVAALRQEIEAARWT